MLASYTMWIQIHQMSSVTWETLGVHFHNHVTHWSVQRISRVSGRGEANGGGASHGTTFRRIGSASGRVLSSFQGRVPGRVPGRVGELVNMVNGQTGENMWKPIDHLRSFISMRSRASWITNQYDLHLLTKINTDRMFWMCYGVPGLAPAHTHTHFVLLRHCPPQASTDF